jgi:hypothetical protein
VRACARSGLLDSEAIVEFVGALCHVAQEELRPVAAPRVYSLTKIVEISHFNMSRIRCAALAPASLPWLSCYCPWHPSAVGIHLQLMNGAGLLCRS